MATIENKERHDFLFTFEQGVNADQSPLLLQKNQLSSGLNTTVRGTHVTHRPSYKKLTVDQSKLPDPWKFQGGCYYASDSGNESLMAALSGELFEFRISGDTVTVYDRTNGLMDVSANQHWLWQAEKWVIWNDGVNPPMHFDGSNTTQSAYGNVYDFTTTVDGTYTVTNHSSAIDVAQWIIYSVGTQYANMKVTSTTDLLQNDLCQVGSYGTILVNGVDNGTVKINFIQKSMAPIGGFAALGSSITWTHYDGLPKYSADQGRVIGSVGTTNRMKLVDVTNVDIGDVVTFAGFGQMIVTDVDIGTRIVTMTNTSCTQSGASIPFGTGVSWRHFDGGLPPGRVGAYGMGRNWICLPDGKQFIASDIVGGSSGTIANNYRDAVLRVTENNYLAGGGNFTVPGSIGDITFMRFAAKLDASLGQGALMVGTPNTIFSCNAPVDRLTWQDLQNPILSESVIGNGGLGQNSSILSNSDIIMRSVDGIFSFTVARRDFDKWGTSLISNEISPILRQDSPNLLRFGSACIFDNRILMTVSPVLSDYGVYHSGLVVINNDTVSTLQGKNPPVYDALAWSGLNVLQLITGTFDDVKRCFAFCYNTAKNELEIYEIGTELSSVYDNGTVPISWSFESGSMFFGDSDLAYRKLKCLVDGEIHVDQLVGTVNFQAFYKPDQWPCWVPWHSWSECSTGTDDTEPQFRPRMGLGEPSSKDCDVTNDRPLRNAYTFQFKLVIQGHCRFMGAKFMANVIPETKCAKPNCKAICS